MSTTRNLNTVSQVEENMHEWIIVRYFQDRAAGQHKLHGRLEHVPVILTMEIIHHQEPTAQQILSQALGFLVVGILRSALIKILHRIGAQICVRFGRDRLSRPEE